MNSIAYFEIQASNPEKTVAFYEKVFGWTFEKDSTLPIEYFRTVAGEMPGAILKRPVAVPPIMSGTNAFTCSMKVYNFDETAKKILENGGQVAMEKFAIPGKCFQGYFLDNDSNVFGIFEVNENA